MFHLLLLAGAPVLRKLSNLLWISLILLAVILPILWMTLLSLKTRVETLGDRPSILFLPTLMNWREAFTDLGAGKALLNSLTVGASSALIAMFTGVPAGYWLSRATTKYKESVLFSIIGARMIPPVGIILPIFLWMRALYLIDTQFGLVLVHGAASSVFACWMMKGFFDQIPKRFEDAAQVDGATQSGALLDVVLPLALPGLLLTAFFAFISSWNEFLFALVLTSYNARTLNVLIPGLITPLGTYWGQVGAVGVLAIIPALSAVVVARNYLVRGVLYGAVRSL
jgi:multiple sugar transport system permease protein